jgi:hypothetical protein
MAYIRVLFSLFLFVKIKVVDFTPTIDQKDIYIKADLFSYLHKILDICTLNDFIIGFKPLKVQSHYR